MQRARGRRALTFHTAVHLGTWILLACLAVSARSSAGRPPPTDDDKCSAITHPLAAGVVEQRDLEEKGVVIRLCGFEAGETVHCYFRSNSQQEYLALTWPEEKEHVMRFRPPKFKKEDWKEGTPRINISVLAVGEASEHSVSLSMTVDAPFAVYSAVGAEMVECPECLFTTEWVSRNAPQWSALLIPWAAKRNTGWVRTLRVLEIGSWEGLSALWWARKLQPKSLTCLDVWEG
eukprot:CAMPEP_0180343536 /NCGR_PEP_ID=MMETSP0989-20121125/2343_1 /TAXON_ID=697907 /ORGANISM="non described non described, Strain CCMP2293" /LENGTH=232 /DNA_ID=CAMNT_0022332509 /DNA_START=96 /DNA_END=790 /DNA_ORIENTATION=-